MVKLEGRILVIIKGEIKLVVLKLFNGVYYGAHQKYDEVITSVQSLLLLVTEARKDFL